MAGLNNRQWMIEVNGQEAGPFTLDELRSLLKEKQILAHFRVRSRLNAAQGWSTVDSLLKQQGAFVPPQRPAHSNELVTRITSANSEALANDPTENLFEALQVAKEKQTGGSDRTKTIIRPGGTTRFRWGTPLIATAGFATLALSLTLWSAHEVFTLSAGRSISSTSDSVSESNEKNRHSAEATIKESADHSPPRFTIGNRASTPPAQRPDDRNAAASESSQDSMQRSIGGQNGPTVIVRTKSANLGKTTSGAANSIHSESTIEEISPQEVQDTEPVSGQLQNNSNEKRLNPSSKAGSDVAPDSDNESEQEESAETRLVNDFQN